jgi:hypothetical protein
MWYGNGDLYFDGIRVAMANGLPSNRMVAAESSNLFFGTGLADERNEVRVLDMADLEISFPTSSSTPKFLAESNFL